MSTPSPEGLSRRDFFQLSAVLLGGVALGDVLPAAGAAADAEALDLTMDATDWLERVLLEREQHRQANKEYHLPEPEDPFRRFLDRVDDVFRNAGRLRGITFNNISATTVGNRLDAQRLAACPHLYRLHTLVLLQCFLGPDGLAALVASPHLGNLRRLVVWMDDVGDEGALALAAAPSLTGLRELSLMDNRLGPRGVRALASSARLERLETLDLIDNPIGDEGARALAASPRLLALTMLRLSSNDIGPNGARALAATTLPRLKEVGLHAQQIGDEAAEALRQRFGSGFWIDDDRAAEVRAAAQEVSYRQAAAGRPDDDALRLRYADWLTSQGDPRGEFIHLQVELAAAADHDPRRHEREVLAQNLLAAYGDHWLEPLVHVVPWILGRDRGETLDQYFGARREGRPRYCFRRGLVEHAHVTPRRFVRYAADLFRLAPSVRAVRVPCHLDGKSWDAPFAACPHLARLSELELVNADADLLGALARSPHLSRLRKLRLTDCAIDPDTMLRLVDPARLPQWTALALSGGDGTAVAGLIEAGRLSRLTSLELRQMDLDGETIEEFFRSPLSSLRTLDLSETCLGDGGASALAAAPHLRALRSLNLTGAELTGEGVAALANSASLPGLEALTLSQNAVGPEGAEALAAARARSGLRLLNLPRAELGSEGVKALAASPFLRGLRWLDLGNNGIGDEGAAALATSALRPYNLEINSNDITAEGAAALASSTVLTAVTDLYVFRNPLGDEGLAALAASPHLTQLRLLAAANVEAGAAGAAALASMGLPQLSVLTLYSNAVGDEGAQAFAAATRRDALRVLSLALAGIGDQGARALAASVALAGLLGLELRGNELSDEVKEALQQRHGSRVRTDGWETKEVEAHL